MCQRVFKNLLRLPRSNKETQIHDFFVEPQAVKTKLTQVTSTTITVEWSILRLPHTLPIQYLHLTYTDDNVTNHLQLSPNASSCRIKDLLPYTSYLITIQSVNEFSVGEQTTLRVDTLASGQFKSGHEKCCLLQQLHTSNLLRHLLYILILFTFYSHSLLLT